MKRTYKKIIAICFSLVLILCTSVNAFAAELQLDSAVSDCTNCDIISISNDYLTYRINDEIAVVEMSRVVEYAPKSLNASWTYTDYTRSKYFYIIETGERVANYSLTASFRYDGESLAECRGTQTHCESLNSKWKIEGIATISNAGTHLGGAVGNFTLSKKNIWGNWVENNTDEVRIWCDYAGSISTN